MGPLLATATIPLSMEPVDTTSERGAPMLMLTTELTEMPLSDPAVSLLPGPPLLATATRAPSTAPVDTTLERGAPTLTTATATDLVLVLLLTPVSPPPTLPGLPRVSMVLSATTTPTVCPDAPSLPSPGARGPLRPRLRPIPTTVTDMATAMDTMAVTTVMDMVMATATATTVEL